MFIPLNDDNPALFAYIGGLPDRSHAGTGRGQKEAGFGIEVDNYL